MRLGTCVHMVALCKHCTFVRLIHPHFRHSLGNQQRLDRKKQLEEDLQRFHEEECQLFILFSLVNNTLDIGKLHDITYR